jgi:hypothetical protein
MTIDDYDMLESCAPPRVPSDSALTSMRRSRVSRSLSLIAAGSVSLCASLFAKGARYQIKSIILWSVGACSTVIMATGVWQLYLHRRMNRDVQRARDFVEAVTRLHGSVYDALKRIQDIELTSRGYYTTGLM